MPRLNLALPLVARATRPLVSDFLVSNSASIHPLNVLARMSGFARDRRSLLLPSLFALCLLLFRILVSGQTLQQAPKAPAAGAKSTPEKVQAKAAAGKPEKPGTDKAKAAGAAHKIPPAPKDVDKGIAITGDFRDIIADKTPSACHPSPKRPDCAMDACAEVLGQDYTIVGEVECLRLSEDQASLIYTTSRTAVDPVYVRLGKKDPLDVVYDFTISKPAVKSATVAMRQVVAADFCRRDKDGHCTTEFLKAEEGKATKSDFETFLEHKAKSLSSDPSTQIKSVDVPKAKGTTDNQFKYSSPDVKNGSLTATFDAERTSIVL